MNFTYENYFKLETQQYIVNVHITYMYTNISEVGIVELILYLQNA